MTTPRLTALIVIVVALFVVAAYYRPVGRLPFGGTPLRVEHSPAVIVEPSPSSVLSAEGEAVRAIHLQATITGAGYQCTQVTRTFRQGQHLNGDVFWNAGCASGGSYLLIVHNDAIGTARVLDCQALADATLTPCFEPLR